MHSSLQQIYIYVFKIKIIENYKLSIAWKKNGDEAKKSSKDQGTSIVYDTHKKVFFWSNH